MFTQARAESRKCVRTAFSIVFSSCTQVRVLFHAAEHCFCQSKYWGRSAPGFQHPRLLPALQCFQEARSAGGCWQLCRGPSGGFCAMVYAQSVRISGRPLLSPVESHLATRSHLLTITQWHRAVTCCRGVIVPVCSYFDASRSVPCI